jgi:ankyrin repeat protein
MVKECKELLNFVLDIRPGPKGVFPIHAAAYFGHKKILEFFENSQIDIKTPTQFGANAVHIAAAGGRIDMIKFLCDEKNFDINSTDKNGMNVLHYAVNMDKIEVIKFLHEEKKMDINTISNGMTPLDLAEKHKRNLIVEYLKSAGAQSTCPAIVCTVTRTPASTNINSELASPSVTQVQPQNRAPLPTSLPLPQSNILPINALQPAMLMQSPTPVITPSYQPLLNASSLASLNLAQERLGVNALNNRIKELEKNDKQKTEQINKLEGVIINLQNMVESLQASINSSKRIRQDEELSPQKKVRLDTKDIEIPDLNELPTDDEMPSTALRDSNAESVRGLAINQLQA